MSKIIYTVLFGNYEELKEPLGITPGWEYICLTDQYLKSNVWNIINRGSLLTTNYLITSAARWNKILGFKEFKQSIYIDASFTINCNLDDFWAKHFISPMTVIPHPIRNCVYEEVQACIRNKRGDYSRLPEQMDKYHAEGLPPHNGLIQSGILLRENTEQVKEFCDLWWDQIKLSTRDQVGFAYAEWKMPGVANRTKYPFDYRTSQEFIYKPHFNRRNASTHRSN